MEGAEERAGVLVTEQVSNFTDAERGLFQVKSRQFMAGVVQELPIAGALVSDAALQGSTTHAQFLRHFVDFGPRATQQALQDPLDLVGAGLLFLVRCQLLVELWRQHLQQLGVVADEGEIEIAAAENNRVALRLEFDRAAKGRFVHLPVLCAST